MLTFKKVKLLIQDDRINPRENGGEALRNAAASGSLDIVQLLLHDRRVDPSDYSNGALIAACQHGHEEIVYELLKVCVAMSSNAHQF